MTRGNRYCLKLPVDQMLKQSASIDWVHVNVLEVSSIKMVEQSLVMYLSKNTLGVLSGSHPAQTAL